MAKKVEFYTITVYENGEKTDYSIMKLFEKLNQRYLIKRIRLIKQGRLMVVKSEYFHITGLWENHK